MFKFLLPLLPVFLVAVNGYDNMGSGWGRSSSTKKPAGSKQICDVPPNPNLPQYIISHGTLINSGDKQKAVSDAGESLPVNVTGYSRTWSFRNGNLGPDYIYVGLVPDKWSSFNGIIFKLPPADAVEIVKATSRPNVCRQSVPRKDIQILGPGGDDQSIQGEFWISANTPNVQDVPSRRAPIVQSYVDHVMNGCLELEEKYNLTGFAQEFVKSTKGWDGAYWQNDRIFPRRPHIHELNAFKIDKILHDTIPHHFNQICIE